jgi:transcriptional regulator with XRE-family HTH domain
MLGIKLVRLIERHSESLSRALAEQIRNSDRTSDFRKIPPKELQLAATEVYRNLGEWLLQKTEGDIASRFKAIAARRASEGISLHQFAWALMLTRDHLWRFLRQEAFADNVVELYAELELYQRLNQFFDRALYYAILGHDEAAPQNLPKSDLQRAQDWAMSVGLISEREHEL